MTKLNHVRLLVRDWRISRDWYRENLGLHVEFEVPRRKVAALLDESGTTLILEETASRFDPSCCVLYFEVDDVEKVHSLLRSKGLRISHGPKKRFWGYGAELMDADGYRVRLWDKRTMDAKG